MDIAEAILQRRSIRAFKPDAVPQETLKEIMEIALRAPSWANTQPCKFAIASGKKLDEIRKGFIEKAAQPSNTDIPLPPGFPEPYDTRRRVLSAAILEVKGIDRDNRQQREWWRMQGLQLFGAPCAIYVCIDRAFYFQGDKLNVWPLLDCGLIVENIMLLATKYGLGTIPQMQAVHYPDVLRRVLAIPDSEVIVVGISIGFPDSNDKINEFRSAREALDKVVNWYGFR